MLEYTNHRNKSYRYGLRMWAILFLVGAIAYLVSRVIYGVKGLHFFGIAAAVIFIYVGFMYMWQSFWLSAYDLTYQVLDDKLRLINHKGKVIDIDYSTVKQVDVIEIKEGMDYYTLHIVTEKHNLVAHIEGKGELANQMGE
nr:hypothetical protein [Lachnospiraceae bacterium]